jgi:hypothetical protein
VKVQGTLLDIERKHGSFNDRTTGNPVAYDFTLLHILDGRGVSIVRLPSEVDARDLPFGKDDQVEVRVSVPVGTKTMYEGLG